MSKNTFHQKKTQSNKIALFAISMLCAVPVFAEDAPAKEEPSLWGKIVSFFHEEKAPEQQQLPPVPVNVMTVVAKDRVPVVKEIVGEVSALQEVQLHAKVGGFLKKKLVSDGAIVKKGDVLFEIDTRDYVAALASAKASLAQAEANELKARQDKDRYGPLVKEKAVSQMDYDHAVSVYNAAVASVEAAKASVDVATINLSDCSIKAPFNGKIGRTLVDEGTLVIAGNTALVTISDESVARFYFTISEREYLEVARHSEILSGDMKVRLVLADGSIYEKEGSIDFADRAIENGVLRFRGEFPNPQRLLIPGMYGRIQISLKVHKDAIVIPQKAVQELLGSYNVTVVDDSGKFERRRVKMGDRIGSSWVAEEGLSANEKIVVDGFQKIRPNSTLFITMVDEDGKPIQTPDATVPAAHK